MLQELQGCKAWQRDNATMRSSYAKYKVYLHQDVYILNQNFIFDLVALFSSNETLGLIGMVGTDHLPNNGIWWGVNTKFGKVIENCNTFRYLEFESFDEDIRCVQGVDRLLMTTQYDIPWREDLFDGWHFYDPSQCIEFIRHGYEVGVAKQRHPWCLHDVGSKHVFDLASCTKY